MINRGVFLRNYLLFGKVFSNNVYLLNHRVYHCHPRKFVYPKSTTFGVHAETNTFLNIAYLVFIATSKVQTIANVN